MCALDPKPGPLVCMHIVFHWATSALLVHFCVLWGWTDVMETDPFYTYPQFDVYQFKVEQRRTPVPKEVFPGEDRPLHCAKGILS